MYSARLEVTDRVLSRISQQNGEIEEEEEEEEVNNITRSEVKNSVRLPGKTRIRKI